MQNLTAQLEKIKITHQKKEELVAEKSSKAKEVGYIMYLHAKIFTQRLLV